MFEGISKKELLEAAVGAVCTVFMGYLLSVGLLLLF
jgi:hypothetical protein